jgi:hypothetical protein
MGYQNLGQDCLRLWRPVDQGRILDETSFFYSSKRQFTRNLLTELN